jgi:hypothetical protein
MADKIIHVLLIALVVIFAALVLGRLREVLTAKTRH